MNKATTDLLLQGIQRVEDSIQTLKLIINDAAKTSPVVKAAVPHKTGVTGNKKSKIQVAESLPANLLPPLPDLQDPEWPQAVPPHRNVTKGGDVEKQFRAAQIVSSVLQGNAYVSEGARVLDVGCGEGHVAKELAALGAELVVGYDVVPSPKWKDFTNEHLVFETRRENVNGSYDLIVLYDALDHIVGDDPIGIMAWAKSLLKEDGRIILRTHPWTARHGGHVYEDGPNLAYLHLIMTPDELAQAGIDVPSNLRLTRPMAAYDHVFKEVGLRVCERKAHTEAVEPFFAGAIMDRILKVTWRGTLDADSALKIMTNQFVDYVLSKSMS